MKNVIGLNTVGAFAVGLLLMIAGGCGPGVKLTGSWYDQQSTPEPFNRILVLALGKDLGKRRRAEQAISRELEDRGMPAATSIAVFGPAFGRMRDTVVMRRMLLDSGFDGALTVRVLRVDEKGGWAPPVLPQTNMYGGFYGFWLSMYGFYGNPAYEEPEVHVLLESNLYRVASGRLLWTGQSMAFDRNPTKYTAGQYARHIVRDMERKGVLRVAADPQRAR